MLTYATSTLYALALFMASGFGLWFMSRYWPVAAPRGYFSRELVTNLAYQLLVPLYAGMLSLLVVVGLSFAGYRDGPVDARLIEGAPPINQWPLWAQIAGYLLLRDFLQYWLHRWLHGASLWPYHAVHHAPEYLEWHHANRFHPVNFLLYVTLADTALYLLGFPFRLALMLAPLLGFFSLFVHSNLNWTYGPLRYVLTSPVFHRWHHSCDAAARDKNFAPNFPFFDLLFRTYYMPKDTLPQALGIAGNNVPPRFWGQLSYPFRSRAAVEGKKSVPAGHGAKNPSNSRKTQ